MAETTSAGFVLNYTISEYVDSFENTSECFTLNYEHKVNLGVCMGISFCGLVDNVIVMRFLFFQVKKNPFTVYTLNLAVADFSLLLLFSLLMLLLILSVTICSLSGYFIFSYMKIYTALGFLCHFFDFSSVGLLSAISVERCVSVLFPIWYRCRRPKHLAGIVSGLLWAFSGALVSFMYLSFYFGEEHVKVFAATAVATCVTFSSMMLISNLSLFIKLQCGFRRRNPGKLYVAVLINVIFFFVLAIPFSVEVFLNLAGNWELFPDSISLLLLLLNCTINPVIYFLVGCCQKRCSPCSVAAALHRVFEEKVTSKEGSRAPEDEVAETMV